MTVTDQPQNLRSQPIDKERLRQKYMEERNKRLRADGNDQYIQVKGQLAHYLDDPYTPVISRDPRTDHFTFAFIGGGFAGLVTAARLSEAGVRDISIIEKGGDFGGTWYWNRYPGAQCDTASLVYMPLLEETGHMPSEKYAHAPEILEHCRRIGKQFGLYDKTPRKTWSRMAGPICRGGSAAKFSSCRASSASRKTCWRRLRIPTSRRWRRSAQGSMPSWGIARPRRS